MFTCDVTEELVDQLTANASLAIEVWGHRNPYHQNPHVRRPVSRLLGRPSRKVRNMRGCSLLKEKSKSLQERYRTLLFLRKILDNLISLEKKFSMHQIYQISNLQFLKCCGCVVSIFSGMFFQRKMHFVSNVLSEKPT